MPSDYKVPYTTILDIQPCPNADRLVLGTIYGWQVVLPKDKFQIGSKVVYVPIDSVLPKNIEDILFKPDSKVKLNKSRIRQIRLRGSVSQGMVIDPAELSSIINLDKIPLETDLSAILNISKYEPPPPKFQSSMGGGGCKIRALENAAFHQYNGLLNIKWNTTMFKEGDDVVIQCKLHGTNARAGKLPYVANTLWKKIKKALKLVPAFEFCYGSNRVQLQERSGYTGFYGTDVYGQTLKSIDTESKIKDGETVFGEIVGPGIQKGYSYGLKEHRFVLFDVKILNPDGSQTWLLPDEVEAFAKERGFEMVPILYKGPYNKELAYQLTKGSSEYNDKSEKVREGIVIKSAKKYDIDGNKQALKWVSEDYLNDPTNTDEH